LRGLGCHGVCHLGLYEQHVSVRTTRVCMNNLCLYRTTCVSVCLQIVASPPACALFLHTLAPVGTHIHTHTDPLCIFRYESEPVSPVLFFLAHSLTHSPLSHTPSPCLSLSPTLPLFLPPWQRRRAHAFSITLPTDW
jgi:hypothetical protein